MDRKLKSTSTTPKVLHNAIKELSRLGPDSVKAGSGRGTGSSLETTFIGFEIKERNHEEEEFENGEEEEEEQEEEEEAEEDAGSA